MHNKVYEKDLKRQYWLFLLRKGFYTLEDSLDIKYLTFEEFVERKEYLKNAERM